MAITVTPITLWEAAKSNNVDLFQQAAQFAIAKSSMMFRFLPFINVSDFQFDNTFSLEEARSTFRALNEELSQGDFDSQTLQYSISHLGDRTKIDRKIIQAKGTKPFANAMAERAAGVGFKYNEAFIKGSKASNPREFNGLQSIMENQIDDSQTLVQGGSGGAALSLLTLDEGITTVRGGADIIFCSQSLFRKFWAAGRDTSVAGFVNYQPNSSTPAGDGLGAAITFYNGIPIVPILGTFNRDDILPYDEISPAGGAAQTTSLYFAKLGEDGLYGAQLGGVVSRNYGNLPGSVFHEGDVEWSPGLGVAHPLAICRIAGIIDAEFVK